MSTKNLARTVIEGGRAAANRWYRRRSNALVRTQARAVSKLLLTRIERDDVIYPPRPPLPRGFSDKLSPAERWLDRQVGRPWNKVRSQLFARFDARTTAGRHILFDHLLPSVDVENRVRFLAADFKVDRGGILRRNQPERRWRRPHPDPLPEDAAILVSWLAGRRVGEHDLRPYWFVPTGSGAFRQHHALSEVEAARWRSLPAWFRRDHDAFAVRPEPSGS